MNPNSVRVGQLVMGLVFLLLTGVWGLYASDTIGTDNLRWLIPLPLLIGGGASLVALAVTSRKRS
ncbi:hypothetical protein Back2_09380 [Nocardioides baekrokdamisoli]|uniref:Uncharacterized protein n=1 Tax=Nocardioides baekrokdamisoli TaxID=1804624 RepID=A0A3G9ISN7_9ACTN|nr:hypothetical protein [Nocardioides baekrokdamisoli]BBH16651.1 hypothetical protein Back2_09380 [Nocardioides baekrokdamisoli]